MDVELDLLAAKFLRKQMVPVHVYSNDSPDCSEYAIHHWDATKAHQHYTSPLDPEAESHGNRNEEKLYPSSGICVDLEPCLKREGCLGKYDFETIAVSIGENYIRNNYSKIENRKKDQLANYSIHQCLTGVWIC